jgi:hypothetical protein
MDTNATVNSLNNIIKTVVRYHHWTPKTIESLYLDDADFFGLLYWYDDVMEVIKEINEKLPKPE